MKQRLCQPTLPGEELFRRHDIANRKLSGSCVGRETIQVNGRDKLCRAVADDAPAGRRGRLPRSGSPAVKRPSKLRIDEDGAMFSISSFNVRLHQQRTA